MCESHAGVPEWSNGQDLRSCGLVPAQVRILSPAIFMKIKSFAENNRPRERLREKGPEALSDAELLALIIKTGTGKLEGK